jgi:hypothetical protein
MDQPVPLSDFDEEAAEREALAAAVAEARANPLGIPHEDMRAWLLKIADGDFTAEPPKPRP